VQCLSPSIRTEPSAHSGVALPPDEDGAGGRGGDRVDDGAGEVLGGAQPRAGARADRAIEPIGADGTVAGPRPADRERANRPPEGGAELKGADIAVAVLRTRDAARIGEQQDDARGAVVDEDRHLVERGAPRQEGDRGSEAAAVPQLRVDDRPGPVRDRPEGRREAAPRTHHAEVVLAQSLLTLGRLAEARRLQEQVLDARRRILGDEHPDTKR